VPIVRVGIAPEVSSAALSSRGAWRIGTTGLRRASEEVAAGGGWEFSARGGHLHAKDQRGIVRDAGAETLYAYPAPHGGEPLRLNGQPYRGEMLIFAAAGGITVVNVVDIESYLRGVVPAEIGSSGPDRIEAVKAQAVAARSYTLAHLNRWRPRGFDVLATAADQVYQGINGERADVDQALRATYGIVAMHEGQPIEAFYSSTCGGTTAEPDEVWDRPSRGYLRTRWDRLRRGGESFCADSPFHRWTATWSGAELEKILKQTLPASIGAKDPGSWGALTDLKLKARSKSKRVAKLAIVFEKATFTIGGDQVRWILRQPGGQGLRSALLLDIDVDRSRGRVQTVRIKGAGFGHGVGLCQYGALGMARAGYDYRQILRFYYKGIRLVRAYDPWPA
jgi:stage II sporulation protein D